MNDKIVPLKDAGGLNDGGGGLPMVKGRDFVLMPDHRAAIEEAVAVSAAQVIRERFIVETVLRFRNDPGVTVSVRKTKVVIEVVR